MSWTITYEYARYLQAASYRCMQMGGGGGADLADQ